MSGANEPGGDGSLLLALGLGVLVAGVIILYLGGLCGFEADAERASACMTRWRLGGGLVTASGTAMFVLGLFRRSRSGRHDHDSP